MSIKTIAMPLKSMAVSPRTAASDPAFKTQHEVKIKIEGVPPGASTLDVYQTFAKEGNIVRIELPDGIGNRTFVTFAPPPVRAFWLGSVKMVYGSMKRSAYVTAALCRESFDYHQSPIDSNVYYPKRISLDVESIDFGVMVQKDILSSMCKLHSQKLFDQALNGCNLKVNLDLRSLRKLEIFFDLPARELGAHSLNEMSAFKIVVPIDTLTRIHERRDEFGTEWTFSLAKPPECFRKTQDITGTHDPKAKSWEERWTWLRQTDIGRSSYRPSTAPVQLEKQDVLIDIGRWITYCLKFDSSTSATQRYQLVKRILLDYSITFESKEAIQKKNCPNTHTHAWAMIDPTGTIGLNPRSTLEDLATPFFALTHTVQYQLEVCLAHGLISEHNIEVEFLERLSGITERRALGLLEKVVETRQKYYTPMDIFRLAPSRLARRRHIGGHHTLMRAVHITPSTMYPLSPVLETSNRIIRRFASHEDRFLRVKFVDEKSQLRSGNADSMAAVYARILRALTHGIRVGGRHYEFLAFGNSQFREHGAFFFASDHTLKAEEIRKWMGDLSHIRVVAKWASRLGQSFSTTRSIFSVRVNVITGVDIERNGYTFTDGVGKISIFLAQMIAKEFNIPKWQDHYPSVYQIRLGGCKGVLAVDPRLPANEVVIRPSQYKFPAAHEGLDICRVSAYAIPKLNRQIILVLAALGIPNLVFLEMLELELIELARAMVDENVAIELLSKRIDFNQTTPTVASMIQDGFMASKEPFVMATVKLWRAWTVKTLREKANLSVDQGAFVLGCVDETATLKGWVAKDSKPGGYRSESMRRLPEIFIQVRERSKGHCNSGTGETLGPYVVKTGICLFARNPSLHPGDIRVVRAVDVPALRHLKDVVVIPQTGDRDLANMCSGGDLDGDDYMVIWDQRLIPHERYWFQDAMDFKAPKPVPLERAVTMEDVAKFFITYMKSNQLGQIAHAHLAHADSSPRGVFDEKCLELAELHSCAVDFPKSGLEVIIPKHLKVPFGGWPHYMEKGKDSRHSKSALGRMYDLVRPVSFEPDYEAPFDRRILEAFDFDAEDMRDKMQKAKELKEEYDSAMKRIMAKYAIQTEFEVWTTFVLYHTRTGSDYKFHEEIGSLCSALKDRFRELCQEAAGGRTPNHLEPFVAAMYKVTADEIASALTSFDTRDSPTDTDQPNAKPDPGSMPLMSFPWLFDTELGVIAGSTNKPEMKPNGVAESAKKTEKARLQDEEKPSVITQAGVVPAGQVLKLFDDASEADPAANQASGSNHINGGASVPSNDNNDQQIKVTEQAGGHDTIEEANKTDSVEDGVTGSMTGTAELENEMAGAKQLTAADRLAMVMANADFDDSE